MAVVTAGLSRAERALQVDDALASVRMEGLEPSAEGVAIFQRYINGELTIEDMGLAIDDLLDKVYGPVRLPRHERP